MRLQLLLVVLAGAPLTAQATVGHPNPHPFAFVANHGQWDARACYSLARRGLVAWVERDALTLDLRRDAEAGTVVRLAFEGAAPEGAPAGEDRLSFVTNYLLGANPALWRKDVPSCSAVRLRALWPGVDLRLREEAGELEYDLLLGAGADLGSVVVRCDGACGLRGTAGGELLIDTPHGALRQSALCCWYERDDGSRRPVRCAYRVLDATRFGFELLDAPEHGRLVVDPGLLWSSFVGGGGDDFAYAVGRSASGHLVVAGETASPNFPLTVGAYRTALNGANDVFVTCFAPGGGALAYSTYLGGSGSERAYDLDVDPTGMVVRLAGFTSSGDFPTTPGAFSTTYRGGDDGFVCVLVAGSVLQASTYLGDTGDDWITAIAVDAGGAVTVGGYTGSTAFPVTGGSYQPVYGGGARDAFVTRFDATLATLIWSTFLGGSGDEGYREPTGGHPFDRKVLDLAVDGAGVTTIAGTTASTNFPLGPLPLQPTFKGVRDVFAARLGASGASLPYSTYLGVGGDERAWGLHVGPSGVATICGLTSSPLFPTTANAWYRTTSGSYDGFVTQLDFGQAVPALVYSTFFGGPLDDIFTTVTVDSAGAITLGGFTKSAPPLPIPTTAGASQTTFGGGTQDGMLVRLEPQATATRLLYSTYVGGSLGDAVASIVPDGQGGVVAAGPTSSANFTTGTFGGVRDAWVAMHDLLPAGATRYGASAPACRGSIWLGTPRLPYRGDALFSVTSTNGPWSTPGALIVASRDLQMGLPLPWLGITVFVDPAYPLVSLPLASDARGFAEVPLPLTGIPMGTRAFTQFVWANTVTCSGSGPLSSSNALDIIVQ